MTIFAPPAHGAGGYQIDNSLRFRSSASAYLSRTITTDATATYFAAVKRGKLGVVSPIFDSSIKFNANDTLTAFGLTTTAVFRDPTSWLFIHVSNGGLYVNGVSYGAVTTSALTNPRIGFDGTNYFDGYMARVGVVAGSSSSYTNFGYLNTNINEWVSKSQAQVKAVVDAGGTNSFMLDFDDASGHTTTSNTGIGKDLSTHGNYWVDNAISLSPGTTYDHMLDVPGNSYAVLNPLDLSKTSGGYVVASSYKNANLTLTLPSFATWLSVGALCSMLPKGKIYFEVTNGDATSKAFGIGFMKASVANISSGFSATAGCYGVADKTANGWGLCKVDNGVQTNNWMASAAASGTVIHGCIDTDAQKIWFGFGGTWGGSGDPANGTNPMASGFGTEDMYVLLTADSFSNTKDLHINFGQRPFTYTPPTGFKALCQANLPDTGTVTVSGTFTGNLNADGPFVWINGVPTTLTINGNAVTFGTHADKTAGGFKLRTASSSYNNTGSNSWTATIVSDSANLFKWNNAQGNP